MASTPVEFDAPTGLTLTGKLFALGSDTLANGSGDAATEKTNNLAVYSITVTEALTGWYRFMAVDGSNNVISSGVVYLEDSVTRRYVGDLTTAVSPACIDGSGPFSVVVTVNDGSVPLQNARVRLVEGLNAYTRQTDAAGETALPFFLEAATYQVLISKGRYDFAGATLVVTGDATPTYSMTALLINEPSDPALCTVRFRVRLSAIAVQGAVCKARLLGINQAADGTILSNEELSVTTDSGGVAELELVRQDAIVKGAGVYVIQVEINGKPVANVRTTIPNQSTVLFEDLIGA
jgi:hypothetical protein